MKKIISVFLIVVMALGIIPFAVNADELTADVVYGTPDAIDGVPDNGWAKAKTYESDKHFSSAPTEIAATWKVMYDSTNLYFLVNVTDSTIGDNRYEECPYPGLGDLWTKNTVQIYLDLGNDKTTNYDGVNDLYIDINARGYVFCHYIKASQFVKAATVVGDTGYVVEVAVDIGFFSEFKTEEGTKFGLDVWASDNLVDGNGRADFVSWTGIEGVYQNTGLLGTATLGAKPDAAPDYNGVIKGTDLKKLGATLKGISNASGGNMNNVDITTFVVDGKKAEGYTADCWSSTYSDELGVWFGVEFDKEYDITQVIFWEGGHWNDGGWFGNSPVLEVYSDGEWKSVDFTMTPSYPADNRDAQADINESYIFNLTNSVECSKVRVRGAKNQYAGHASVSEIEVYAKTQEETPVTTPDTTPVTTPDTTPVTTPDTTPVTTPVTNPKTGNALSAMLIITTIALFGTAAAVATAKRKF